MKHQLINVIVAGFPMKLAAQVAQTCKNRGFNICKFGLAIDDFDKEAFEVANVGKLRMLSFSDKDLKDKLAAEVDLAKQDNRFPVVADVSNRPEHVELYNSVKIPFVMQSSDHKSRIQANERSHQLAVIADDFNKYAVAFDAIMREWGRRFPGLFRGFEVEGVGASASRHLAHSLNDLLDKDLGKPGGDPIEGIEGRLYQEFSFKNGSGSTIFSFKRSAGPEEYAEGMADAIQFLATQAENQLPPRVYSMVDVARRAPLMMM